MDDAKRDGEMHTINKLYSKAMKDRSTKMNLQEDVKYEEDARKRRIKIRISHPSESRIVLRRDKEHFFLNLKASGTEIWLL